jgi:hypothetical protein
MKKGETHEAAHWTVETDEDTGEPYWSGAGAGDKERTDMDPDECLEMNPKHFPPGTRVVVTEPWDPDFYSKLFEAGRNEG